MSSLPLQKSLYPLLRPLGAAYRVLMRARRRRYENGAACRTDVPCVSVGNIGWGGSGKTPVVQWLLQWAAVHGLHAVVLTRGYKASPPGLPYVVTPQSSAAHAGDEPLMLARSCPQATVVVDPVRSRSARWAQERLAPDFFVLDDGFQHVQVARDTDLVLLKKDDLHAEWGRVLPAGSWREGPEALSRAAAFCIKCGSGEFSGLVPDFENRLGSFGVPVFGFSLRPGALIPVCGAHEGAQLPAGAPYVLFSGVGDPAQVAVTVSSFLGYDPVRHHVFADHHGYTQADMDRMAGYGLPLVCTPKDAVKLTAPCGVPVWTLSLETNFHSVWNAQPPAGQAGEGFAQWWQCRWQRLAGLR
jgi:tetraacyldisaccharide 4'-kinase